MTTGTAVFGERRSMRFGARMRAKPKPVCPPTREAMKTRHSTNRIIR